MTKEKVKELTKIVNVLERIDRVLSVTVIISNGGSSVKLNLQNDAKISDMDILARCFEKEFLELLYNKKLELEDKLKKA